MAHTDKDAARWRRANGILARHVERLRCRLRDREAADAALEESRQELMAIYQHAPLLMCTLDADRRVVYANKAFAAFTGVPEVELVAGRACGVFGCINAALHPRGCGFAPACSACSLRLALDDTIRSGRAHQDVEYRATLELQGRRRDVVLRGSTVRIPRQGHRLVLLCLEDATHTARLAEAMRERDAKLTDLLENTGDQIASRDRAHRLINFNAAFAKMARRVFGVEARPGLCTLDHMAPAERAHWEQALRGVLAGFPYQEVFSHVAGNGEVRYYATTLNPIWNDDAVAGTTEFTRDVTDLKRAEALYRDLVENINDVVFTLDAAGLITYVSPVIRNVLGYDPAELVDTPLPRLVSLDDAAAVRSTLAAVLAGASRTIEFRMLDKRGTWRWMGASCRPIAAGPGGTVSGVRGLLSDIAARRQAQDALLASEARLRAYGEQLRALAAHLETARERERSHIAREVHDEFGQNLTALKLDLRWMERTLDKLPASPHVEALRQRLAGSIEVADANLASVQRLAAELRPGVLDKLGIGPAMQYEGRRFHERTGISCAISLPAAVPPLSPELTTALFRVFQECLTNVARHAQANQVAVEFQVDGADVRLSVRDDGRGIREEDLNSPHALGLLGMRERAAGLGGRVDVRRPAGGGTEVCVQIPLACREEGR